MSKFKVGDDVYIKNYEGGRKYPVVRIGGGKVWVWYEDEEYSYSPEHLVLAEAKPTYPNPPHKHAEVIKAWADGAEIEVKHGLKWQAPADGTPKWVDSATYRIKPAKSEKELQIEKLEQQAKDLADEISKLKGL